MCVRLIPRVPLRFFVTITSKNTAAITFDLYHDDDINGYNNFILYYEKGSLRRKCIFVESR